MPVTNLPPNKLALYQTKDGALQLRTDADNETIWANLNEIATLFDRDKSVISRHIKNIFKEEELSEKVVVAFFATTTEHGAIKGKIQTKEVKYFNLDLIISVGYRVNSKVATQFRIWATKTLKQHITQGFTINETRIKQNKRAFLQAVEDIKTLAKDNQNIQTQDILELIKSFSHTWFSLDSYDKNTFPQKGTKKEINITSEELAKDLQTLKQELIQKQEASELFAGERASGSLAGIVGNVFQSVFGDDVYKSVEEKAAHLLYFIIKNHPFTDGNKRSGAFAFIWFLQKSGYNFAHKINPETLATLTILIAESSPKDKDKMIGVVLLLLQPHS